MKTKFKVIANYPLSPYKIGDIIESTNGQSIHMFTTHYQDGFGNNFDFNHYYKSVEFEKFPALFEKIN